MGANPYLSLPLNPSGVDTAAWARKVSDESKSRTASTLLRTARTTAMAAPSDAASDALATYTEIEGPRQVLRNDTTGRPSG